jgi:putative membrane protein
MNRLALIAAACALAFAGTATAGGDKHASHDLDKKAADAATMAPYSDAMFFESAANAGMLEVEAGKVAIAKGNSDDVRSFGQKMVTDHTKKNDELKALAAKKNVTLPTALDAKHQEKMAKFNSLSGDAFDHAYAADMVTGHADMHALMEQAATSSKDADVRVFAQDTLNAVKQHHELAVKLEAKELAETPSD